MEPISQLIHKKKEAKKNTKGQLPIGQKDNRTIGKGSTPSEIVNRLQDNNHTQQSTEQPAIDPALQRKRQIDNQAIDEYLFGLIMEGILDENYMSWGAKCIHTLGLTKVNAIVINARNGNNPQRLLAYKLNGAIQLHFKKQFYLNDSSVSEE